MWRKLGIEPGEGRVFAWGAAALFMLGWSDVSLKNVAEVVFLKRVGVQLLPWAFLASSALLVVSTWAFGRVAARSDRLKLLPRTFGVLGLLILPLWVLVLLDVEQSFGLLLVAEKQITSISLLVFWIAMGDLLHSRQAKRLFAPMMAGVTVGTILGSFASAPLGRWLGIESLLPISALTLLASAAASLPLRSLRPRFERGPGLASRQVRSPEPSASAASAIALWGESPLFRVLLVMALCSGLLGPMLYFQFQYVANLATSGAGGEERLLEFYAQFRGWIYGGVLLTQLWLAAPLYRRIGVPLAAALSPLVYLAGFLGLSVRLSLPAGVGAMAGTKLLDSSVYEPALRVLYNLFPENLRSRATAWVEGPLKRAGGALGNAVVLVALQLGSAPWVGYSALPIAFAWWVASLVLWRRYPRMLLAASAAGVRDGDGLERSELLDPATVRALVPEMCSADPARARVAVELVADAETERAAAALAEAAGRAPAATRSLLLGALDRVLERAVVHPVTSLEAARSLEPLLDEPGALGDADRADLVQAYGRLMPDAESVERLEGALEDASPAVRLAARAALVRRNAAPPGPDLDAALVAALAGDDAAARRTAREELRALLLCDGGSELWQPRLELLAAGLVRGPDRAETAEALAEVALRHGERAAVVRETVLPLRDDPDPRIRAALLRFCGHARLEEQVSWLVEHLGAERPAWVRAARDGLVALGAAGTNALMRELAYGKRSKREGILEVMRELDLQPTELKALYEAELDAVERDLRWRVAIGSRPAFSLLHQRLGERVREEIHTALLFLAAIRHEHRIAQLGDRLQQVAGLRRQHAIVVEALESVLSAEERERLVPLLEDPDLEASGRNAARRAAVPSLQEALAELLQDPEELTRTIAAGEALAAGFQVVEDSGVDAVEKMVHLKALPLFEGLTARQLMDLARVAREHSYPDGAVVVTQGDCDDRLFLVVDGAVRILRGDTLLAEMGPGDFFGEIALFEGVARSATAVTRGRARLLGLERSDLMRLIEEMPGIAISLLEVLSKRVRELTDRLMV